MGTVAGHGRFVHLTGQVAWDADERLVGAGDVAAQTEQTFRNIAALLQQIGGQMNDIVSVTTWFVRDGDLSAIQTVRARWLDFPNPPASTSVRVAGLGDPGFLVELTPVAVIPEDRLLLPA